MKSRSTRGSGNVSTESTVECGKWQRPRETENPPQIKGGYNLDRPFPSFDRGLMRIEKIYPFECVQRSVAKVEVPLGRNFELNMCCSSVTAIGKGEQSRN